MLPERGFCRRSWSLQWTRILPFPFFPCQSEKGGCDLMSPFLLLCSGLSTREKRYHPYRINNDIIASISQRTRKIDLWSVSLSQACGTLSSPAQYFILVHNRQFDYQFTGLLAMTQTCFSFSLFMDLASTRPCEDYRPASRSESLSQGLIE